MQKITSKFSNRSIEMQNLDDVQQRRTVVKMAEGTRSITPSPVFRYLNGVCVLVCFSIPKIIRFGASNYIASLWSCDSFCQQNKRTHKTRTHTHNTQCTVHSTQTHSHLSISFYLFSLSQTSLFFVHFCI